MLKRKGGWRDSTEERALQMADQGSSGYEGLWCKERIKPAAE